MNDNTEYPNLLALLTALEGTEYPEVHLTSPATSSTPFRIGPPSWGRREIGAFTEEGWVNAGYARPAR